MLVHICPVELTSFTHADRSDVDPWFDDDDTRRFIGGTGWVEHSLLHAPAPPTERQGRQIVTRLMWVAREDGLSVGVVDVATYDDQTAELALIVAPERRRAGLCKEILAAVVINPALADVLVMRLGVEPDNIGAARCAEAVGFSREPSELNEQGMTHFVRSLGPTSA